MSGRATGGPLLGGSTVSTGSAARFAARVRSRRRRRIAVVAGVALLAVGAVAAGLYSPWTTVQQVTVTGTTRIPVTSVQALVADQHGRPLLLVDTSALSARVVAALPLAAGASVRRTWPSTLAVVVRERTAVAAVPSGAGVRLVDVDGVEVATAQQAPAGLPVVQVDLDRAAPGSLAAVLQVLGALPVSLSRQVAAVGAVSPDSVWLTLLDGSRVLWGSSADTPDKAVVLSRLRVAAQQSGARVKGRQYDVSAPDAPAVSVVP
jgi:cell division protein FtsQ